MPGETRVSNENMNTSPEESQLTRQRLLDAAGEIFAERGFRNATVREICERAGANIAAINYHFRDKEGLYAEVIRYAHRCVAVQPQRDMAAYGSAPAGEKLRVFVRLLLRQLLEPGKPAWHMKLVAREMMDPSAALDRLVEEEIRPKSQYVQALIREILGSRGSQRDVELSAMSVISQCIFYRQCKPVISRLKPEMTFSAEQIDVIADHIARFSLGALAKWKTGGGRGNP